jgi:hypothetical protein
MQLQITQSGLGIKKCVPKQEPENRLIVFVGEGQGAKLPLFLNRHQEAFMGEAEVLALPDHRIAQKA